jgi:hypothetical protein
MPRALFIDVQERTIERVGIRHGSAAVGDLRDLIGGYIEGAYHWPNGDVLFVDEEGLLKPWRGGFLFALRADEQPLAGNGVVVGREIEGRGYVGGYTTLAPTITVAELRRLVLFLDADGQPTA